MAFHPYVITSKFKLIQKLFLDGGQDVVCQQHLEDYAKAKVSHLGGALRKPEPYCITYWKESRDRLGIFFWVSE